MKTKIMTFLMAAALAAGMISACGTAQEAASPGEKTEKIEEAVTQDDTDTTEYLLGIDAKTEETVIYDNEGIKITADELKFEYNLPVLTFTFENNTDKNLKFMAGTGGYSCNAINGYMLDSGYVHVSVAAGETGTDTMNFAGYELELLGITEIADIEVAFDIEDDEYNHFIQTGALKIPTSKADGHDYDTDTFQQAMRKNKLPNDVKVTAFTDEVLFENNGARIIAAAMIEATGDEEEDEEHVVVFETENTTDQLVHVLARNIRVNGTMLYEYARTGDEINAGDKALSEFGIEDMLDEGTLADNGIDKIEEVSFDCEILDETGMNVIAKGEVTFRVR